MLFFLCLLLLSACTLAGLDALSQGMPFASGEEGISDGLTLETAANTAVKDFYSALNQGKYEQASELFGGSYEVLQGFNPTIDPGDTASLLQTACEFNGFMCLKVLNAELVEDQREQGFIFEVTFENLDGSEFVLGPCCGASEAEMPPQTIFIVHVVCDREGTCQVMDLPPYVP